MTLSLDENTPAEVVINPTDDEPKEKECLLTKAEELFKNEKLLEAAKILKAIDDPEIVLKEKHLSIIEKAKEGQALVDDLKQEGDGEWIDHGVSGGKFPTRLLHRLENTAKGVQLRARCETPIPKDLLSPLISVLNESQLYKTWLPSWTTPRFGVRECDKLKQIGRCSQILRVVMDLPWPMSPREFVLYAMAFDDIEKNGDIAIKIKTITTSDNVDDVVPKPDKKNVLVDIDGGFLFSSCPKDHPAMKKIDSNEEMILVRFSAMMNPNMKLLPQSFLNFLVKVAFGTCWKIMLGIALDVKNGKRPDHAKAISTKEELYAWIEARLIVMLSILKGTTQLN